jgi:hypothetical protein
MMRTIEILIVIVIITGAFIAASFFAVLPGPREVSPLNLRRLSLTTLQVLESEHGISRAAFEIENQTIWTNLQVALSASLPPNVIYNLTVYDVSGINSQLYTKMQSISNAEDLGITSNTASFMVSSSNVTFNVIPEKIGELEGGVTLYILDCSDANSWWITGYTAHSLAQDLKSILSPYFTSTVMVQTTDQLGQILDGTSLQGEPIQNAVVINTCGEAVPIPSGYYSSNGVGYDIESDSFARYTYTLGQRVLEYNWTWVSTVGYPLYYVSNNQEFPNDDNDWGIYGMKKVGPAGFNAFLKGLDNQSYSYNSHSITGSPGIVNLSNQIVTNSNYYGIYPAPSQTSTRALPNSIIQNYNLEITTEIFDRVSNWISGAMYRHITTVEGASQHQGSIFALGLARTPDIRLTALGILSDFQPRLFNSEFNSNENSRLVVLQLGLVGGA